MSQRTATRRVQSEQGFTLVELMVVVLVLAILMAIAIPTFLGARNRSQDRSAQSSLTNGLTAAQIAYTDTADYSGASSNELPAIEPSYTYLDSGKTSSNEEELSVSASGQTWAAAALSDSGTCYLIRDVRQGGDAGTWYGSTSNASECSADFASKPSNTAEANW